MPRAERKWPVKGPISVYHLAKEVGNHTGIHPEDCLAVMNGMLIMMAMFRQKDQLNLLARYKKYMGAIPLRPGRVNE